MFTKGNTLRKAKAPWNKGLKTPLEIKEKLSIAKKGKYKEENNPAWKGDNVGYRGLHLWITKRLGKATTCSYDSDHKNTTRFEWANVSHSYKRNLDDWISLCVQCHRQYDKILRGGAYS